jgi:hypothetical protein
MAEATPLPTTNTAKRRCLILHSWKCRDSWVYVVSPGRKRLARRYDCAKCGSTKVTV